MRNHALILHVSLHSKASVFAVLLTGENNTHTISTWIMQLLEATINIESKIMYQYSGSILFFSIESFPWYKKSIELVISLGNKKNCRNSQNLLKINSTIMVSNLENLFADSVI